MEWEPGVAIALDSAFVEIPEEDLVLVQAVRYNDVNMLSRQIHHGADVNAKHIGKPCLLKLPYLFREIRLTGYSCLHIAVLHCNIKLIEFLLSNGADIDILDAVSRTPLVLATAIGRLDVVDLLLNKGADTNIQTSSKRTAVMEAVCRQDLPVLQRLLEAKCDLTLTDIKGGTLLYFACSSNSPDLEIIQHLIDAGADVNQVNSKGASVLMIAVRHIDVGVIKLLYDGGADINIKDIDGKTAFHLAIANFGAKRSMAAINFLLSHGADADSPDKNGNTPLQLAVQFGKLRCIERLLKADCDRSYVMLTAWRIVQLCTALPKFKEWLDEEFYTPRSLLRFSRGVLRKSIVKNIGQVKVDDLEIPQVLKDFVLVKHYVELEV